MAQDGPAWRRTFDNAERAVAPRLEELVRSEQFAIASGLMAQARVELARRFERNTRRALHLINLPAGSDVTRLMGQIGSLERQVRELTKRLEDAGEATNNAKASRPRRAGGKDPT